MAYISSKGYAVKKDNIEYFELSSNSAWLKGGKVELLFYGGMK